LVLQEVSAAQRVLLDAIESTQSAKEPGGSATAPAVIKATETAKVAQETILQTTRPADVSQENRKKLDVAIFDFRQEVEKEAVYYGRLYTAFTIGGLVFALVAALSNFMNWTRAAGIASILASAVIAAPKVLPFDKWADFYRAISIQSYGLLQEERLQLNMNELDYASFAKRHSLLVKALPANYPSNVEASKEIESLVRNLQASRNP
jgi:hypothetical protein